MAVPRLAYIDFMIDVRRLQLLQALAQRLRRTNEAMADLVFSDVPGRVAKTLLDLADRFGTPGPDGVRVTHDLTQEELAQLVGASRETVNKALSEFASQTRSLIALGLSTGRSSIALSMFTTHTRSPWLAT